MIDSSVAGLGGCPYAEGASGNMATEDVLGLLRVLGIHAAGVDAEAVFACGDWICSEMGRETAAEIQSLQDFQKFEKIIF